MRYFITRYKNLFGDRCIISLFCLTLVILACTNGGISFFRVLRLLCIFSTVYTCIVAVWMKRFGSAIPPPTARSFLIWPKPFHLKVSVFGDMLWYLLNIIYLLVHTLVDQVRTTGHNLSTVKYTSGYLEEID